MRLDQNNYNEAKAEHEEILIHLARSLTHEQEVDNHGLCAFAFNIALEGLGSRDMSLYILTHERILELTINTKLDENLTCRTCTLSDNDFYTFHEMFKETFLAPFNSRNAGKEKVISSLSNEQYLYCRDLFATLMLKPEFIGSSFAIQDRILILWKIFTKENQRREV